MASPSEQNPINNSVNGANSTYQPPPGRLGNLTIVQNDTLEEMKTELQAEGLLVPERHDDATLLRFLRARRFDLVKAKKMLIAAEGWWKDFGVDDIEKSVLIGSNYVRSGRQILPQFYHKTDKDGCPVYIERLSRLDDKALSGITTQDRMLKHLVQEYEKMIKYRYPACSKLVDHPVETTCTILDLYGVSTLQFYQVRSYVAAAAKIGQDYYPEVMGSFYIINAPFLFSAVWSLIKPWLDEVTVAKINILGEDYKRTLLTQIPAENLPMDLGGTCQCVGGCSLSDAGPWNEVRQAKNGQE
ncbi:hypothetical protein Clacol_001957 [Clathrus columnatus]|uniref:CRAL-TRIO domain-containing protein n=1 Tax=Clathrus columnatus TaxID=1419009 RepID=A0AAV5A2S8_9AGAM|nr:hypothetical protein Clacol_001957 [Clathrus columnatus]